MDTQKPKPPQCCYAAAAEIEADRRIEDSMGCRAATTEETAAIIAEQTRMAETIRLLKLSYDLASAYESDGDGPSRLMTEITAHLAKLEGNK